MMLKEKIKKLVHKAGVNPNDWTKVHPNLLVVLDYVIEHCHAHNLPVVISSIIRPRLKVSKTDTHSEGRAFDISVRGWQIEDIEFLVDCINADLYVGAISKSDGLEREALYEPDEFEIDPKTKKRKQVKWAHIHFQCARKSQAKLSRTISKTSSSV